MPPAVERRGGLAAYWLGTLRRLSDMWLERFQATASKDRRRHPSHRVANTDGDELLINTVILVFILSQLLSNIYTSI